MKNALNQEVEGLFVGQVIDLLIERKEGYLKASEKMSDPYLKQLFFSHSQFSDLLKHELYSYSEDESYPSSFGGWKQFSDMDNALKTGQRRDLLEACIIGEQNAISFYLEILKVDILPSPLKAILERQLKQIRSACDLLKIFKICL